MEELRTHHKTYRGLIESTGGPRILAVHFVALQEEFILPVNRRLHMRVEGNLLRHRMAEFQRTITESPTPRVSHPPRNANTVTDAKTPQRGRNNVILRIRGRGETRLLVHIEHYSKLSEDRIKNSKVAKSLEDTYLRGSTVLNAESTGACR